MFFRENILGVAHRIYNKSKIDKNERKKTAHFSRHALVHGKGFALRNEGPQKSMVLWFLLIIPTHSHQATKTPKLNPLLREAERGCP